MKTKQLKWLLGLLAIVTIIAVGVMIGMTPESLQAKKSNEVVKTTKKASASPKEETLPEVEGQPRVVYPANPNLPIVSRDEISDLEIIPDPTFKKWDDKGVPEGWTPSLMFGGQSTPTTGFAYAPGETYQPSNYNQMTYMWDINKHQLGMRDYAQWQRVDGGGLRAKVFTLESDMWSPNMDIFEIYSVDISPDNGGVFYMDAEIEKAHLDFVPFKTPSGTMVNSVTTENPSKSRGSFRLRPNKSWGSGANLRTVLAEFKFTDTPQKIKELKDNLTVNYSDYKVLTKEDWQWIKETPSVRLELSSKGVYEDGVSAPNDFYYNALQFNYASLYTMDLLLNVKDNLKDIPLGTDFGKTISKSDLVNAVESAEYVAVDKDGNVTKESLDLSTLDCRGILDEYPDTSSIGEKTFRVYFTGKNSAGKTIRGIVPMKANVVWNKALSLGSNNTNSFGNDASATAFSLIQQPGGQYEIVSTYGDATSTELPLQDTGSDTYYQVDLYKKPASGTLALTEDLNNKGYASLTAKGDNTPAQLMNAWGGKNDGRQAVSIGDILRVYIANPARELVRDGETVTFRAGDAYRGEYVFYEVTTDGFKPLYLNQVKGKTNIPAYHNETIAQITADFKAHKDNYIETMPTGTYTGVSWDGSFKTANSPDTSVAEKKDVPGILTLGATMAMGSYTLTVGDFTITPTFDIGKAGVEPPEPEEQWELVLNSDILKEFDVGAAEPSNTTIKDWFYGQVNFRNVNTGELLYSGGGGLPRDNFSVDLVTNWDSQTAGTFPYAVKITVTSEPSSVAGKLVSNTMTTSGNQLQIKFNQTTTNGGEIIVYYYLDEDHYQGTVTVPGGTIGSTATIPKPSYNNDYDFDRAVINSPANTVYSWPENIKFTAEQQKVWIYYTTKPTEPEKGGKIQVNYYLDSVDNASIGQKTVPGGDVGTYATIPQFEGYTAADLKEAILPDGTKLTTWPTDKIKFTTADQMVWIVYNSKQVNDVTVKVTMVDEAGNPINFPPGTMEPLTLYDSSTVFATDSTVSGSTVSFVSKIKKGDFYRIGQNTAIDGYLKYDQDPKAGENQTPKIGVSTDNKAEFSGHEKPPTEENGWIVYLGVSLKYDASSSTLNVKITNKTATVYKLSVDTQTIDLWAGDPIRTSAELKEIFRGHIKAVEDKTPVPPGIELSDSQYSLEITSNWVNTVTPVGSPRSFTVKVTPTQAAINEYPGLATLSGEYLKVNFKEITYELQATGVAHEYWSNDPQPNADERLTWVEDVKILPSNTPDTTDTTATKVEITGFKDGGTTKPTTEVDMTKLGETIYLVTVTAKNPLNKDTEITRENVEVPITIVAPPTYELKINVVDTDGKPINYEDVSAPFGYTLDGKDNWDTTATTAENVITFTNKLDIQSKYQIEQSDVLQPNTEETSEELPNDTSVVFPPESGIKPPGLTQELHTKTLTETYPWNEQKASLSFVISRDESTLSYGSKTYDTDTENPIELADGLKAKYNKDERILELTVTNDQGELSLAVPDLIFQQGTPGIMKEQLLERKENAKDPWKVKIKDTLQTNQMWSLEAKLTEPFTLTGENREIKDILVYKETPTSAQQLMVLDQAMPILDKTSAGAPNTEQFYEKTWEKQAGFLLSVDKQKSMGIKGGVYTAALEFTLKDAD